MAIDQKLSQLTLGASARIKDFPKAGTGFLRLREMGLLPGTTVTFVRSAPMGDPIEIKVRGYHLSLRAGVIQRELAVFEILPWSPRQTQSFRPHDRKTRRRREP